MDHQKVLDTPVLTPSRLRELTKPTVDAWKTLFNLDERRRQDRQQLHELTEALASYGEMLLDHHIAKQAPAEALVLHESPPAPPDLLNRIRTTLADIIGPNHHVPGLAAWRIQLLIERIDLESKSARGEAPLPAAPPVVTPHAFEPSDKVRENSVDGELVAIDTSEWCARCGWHHSNELHKAPVAFPSDAKK